jgi:putative membrane protein
VVGAAVLTPHEIFQVAEYKGSFLWSWEPAFTVPLFAFGLLLATGLVRLGARTSYSRQWRHQSIFLPLGWLSLVVALNSPIHALGEQLFWVHMIQHEALLLISAPLFVLGNVLPAFIAAFPRGIGSEFGTWFHASGIYRLCKFLSRPLPAWFLGAAGLWIWHIPYLFDATLRNDWVHAAQHFTFLTTSYFFWLALLEVRTRHAAYGTAVLYLFATSLQTALLGVLLTYSAHPWYLPYIFTAPQLGYSPLEDQQIGGLIMWVPGGLVFTAAALALVPGWLRSSEARHALWAQTALDSKNEGGAR